jgi:hypothetical protein
MLGDLTRETADRNDIVKQTAGSIIFALQQQAKKSDRWDIAYIFGKMYTRTDCED